MQRKLGLNVKALVSKSGRKSCRTGAEVPGNYQNRSLLSHLVLVFRVSSGSQRMVAYVDYANPWNPCLDIQMLRLKRRWRLKVLDPLIWERYAGLRQPQLNHYLNNRLTTALALTIS